MSLVNTRLKDLRIKPDGEFKLTYPWTKLDELDFEVVCFIAEMRIYFDLTGEFYPLIPHELKERIIQAYKEEGKPLPTKISFEETINNIKEKAKLSIEAKIEMPKF